MIFFTISPLAIQGFGFSVNLICAVEEGLVGERTGVSEALGECVVSVRVGGVGVDGRISAGVRVDSSGGGVRRSSIGTGFRPSRRVSGISTGKKRT